MSAVIELESFRLLDRNCRLTGVNFACGRGVKMRFFNSGDVIQEPDYGKVLHA
jgi:hypothetical protein